MKIRYTDSDSEEKTPIKRPRRPCSKHRQGYRETDTQYYWRMEFDETAGKCPQCERRPSLIDSLRPTPKKTISLAAIIYLVWLITDNITIILQFFKQ